MGESDGRRKTGRGGKGGGGGNVEIREEGRGKGGRWGEKACVFATDCGKFEVLQWMRANG